MVSCRELIIFIALQFNTFMLINDKCFTIKRFVTMCVVAPIYKRIFIFLCFMAIN